MPRTKRVQARKTPKPRPTLSVPQPNPATPATGVVMTDPHFGEPAPSADPTKFLDQPHDSGFYKQLNKSLLQAVPPPPHNPALFPDKLILTLEQAMGAAGTARVKAIQQARQIVFHSAGDTGPTKGPVTLTAVVDKMNQDFAEVDPADIPAFFYHLGDVIYNFGEDEYYYDQFYEPFRDYQAPIFAIPGNHDGMMYTGAPGASLSAFLKHFCADTWRKLPEAAGLPRTAMVQPSVYFRLDAPFVRIIGLYSNVLEGPGVISSQGRKDSPVSDDQLVFLKTQLNLLKQEKYAGALILAVHHPPFTVGSVHGGGPNMLDDLDACFKSAGVYPHAVISGHAHNYQRFTRSDGGREVPYIIAGSGGHAANPLRPGKNSTPIRTPLDMSSTQAGGRKVRLETYFPRFGYLRVVVNASLLSLEFHEVGSGLDSKSPIDVVTVDLQSHMLTTTRP
jgi:hypothetical protein